MLENGSIYFSTKTDTIKLSCEEAIKESSKKAYKESIIAADQAVT